LRTYGSVAYDEEARQWVVKCEPHVAARLKRTFARLSSASFGEHRIGDTIDTGRDLEWFLMRYPCELSAEAAYMLRKRADQHRDRQQDVENILAGRVAPDSVELAVPLREYQKQAVAMARIMKGMLLADDVGIGKTASAIGTIANPELLPALVVTLTHLPTQWKAEIEKFAPTLRTHILTKGTPYPIAEPPDVFISNYHKLGGWAETLSGVVRSVVFDECQELRKGGTVKYHAAKHIASGASLVLGLSATPIYNQGSEFHSVAEVLRPDCLGTRTEFVREWCSLGSGDRFGTERVRDPEAFGEFVREVGLMLRRTRAEVGRELPALTRVPQHIDADLGALDEVSDACRELALFIVGRGEAPRKGDADAKKKNEHFLASGELDYKLRQATGIAKAPFVSEFVRLLVEQEERVVLYGWHREVYRIWMERLKNLSPRLYTGTESPREKDKAREDFLAGRSKVLIMSLRAGAGLDGLQQCCRTVVFGELDWSYGVHEQAEGRVCRDGQTDPVFAYYLTADVGSDPIVMDMLGIKRGQLEGIRDPKHAFVTKLQTDPDRIKRLAEAYLEQRVTRRKKAATESDSSAAE
jgi:hypothetical protein